MKIEERLENWARAQRSTGAGSGGSGLTSQIYFRSERVPGLSIDASVDGEDVGRVERAWRGLLPLDRKMLQMHYVWRMPAAVICRRLGLKVRPTTVFDLALAHAKRAIEERLHAPQPDFVSIQSIIEKLADDTLAKSK